MRIIYEDNHLLVVIKEANVPMQEDASLDSDLLSKAKAYIKTKYHKQGNVYLGLVHRLDRPVSGICVLAKTSKAASRLSESIRNHSFKKEYLALVLGKVFPPSAFLKDKLLKDYRNNIVKVDEKGKEASLSYELIGGDDNYSLVKIDLHTGRPHQIRVQFSSRGFPLYGDQRYNKMAKVGRQIALLATKISFPHPTRKEIVTFVYPFEDYPAIFRRFYGKKKSY